VRGALERLARPALILAAVAAVAVCLAATAWRAVNVPFLDDWDVLGPIIAARSGTLLLDFLWSPANEHRPVLGRVVALGLSFATAHDVRASLVVSRLLELAALGLLGRGIRRTVTGPTARAALGAATAWLLFSATRYETWTWALVSIQWSAHILALVGLAVLVGPRRAPTRHVLAAGALVIADGLGMSTALPLWLVGLAALASDPHPGRGRNLATWLGVGGILAIVVGPPLWRAHGAAGPDPGRAAILLAAMAGSPFAFLTGRALPVLVGSSGLVAFAVACARGWRIDDRRPWLVLGVAAVTTMAVISAARAAITAPELMPPRYTVDAAILWISIAGLAVMSAEATARWRGLLVAAAVLLVLYARAYAAGWHSLGILSDRMAAGREAVLAFDDACDDELAVLYPPSPTKVRRYARALEAQGLGPFADGHRGRGRCPGRVSARTLAERAPWGVEGGVERVDCAAVTGWAVDAMRASVGLPVELWSDGHLVANTRAEPADGARFEIPLPDTLRDGLPHRLAVRISGLDADLEHSAGTPATMTCPYHPRQ
jgi:hypothetical protein